MPYMEIYCSNCRRALGTYNAKYYTDSRLWEVTQASHVRHIRDGHVLVMRTVKA